jgi:Transposase IS200 like.
MPQLPVPLVNGELYHVYNRGVDKRNVFLDESDFTRFYLSLHYFNSTQPTIHFRAAQANKEQKVPLVHICAYALLPNHYHLIVRQVNDNGISEFMKRMSAGYTGYFNEKYERSGSLFQGKFKRVHITSQEQLQYLIPYVNENYSVHKLKQPNSLLRSSSLHYQGAKNSKIINEVIVKNYNSSAARELVKYIYAKRCRSKDLLE